MNQRPERNYINDIDDTDERQPQPAAQEKKPRRSAGSLIVGVIVILLAAYGVYQLASMGVSWYRTRNAEKENADTALLYDYIIPAAAIDVSPFEDVTAADMRELVEMSVWAVLNSGLDPTQYQYSSDALMLPEAQVTAAFIRFFGTERTIQHVTVEGYGYQFTYDAAGHVYQIPLTTITPLYTPVITETEYKGDSTVLTVGYLNAALYETDSVTGQLKTPEPDKYVKVTLRAASTGTYISSIRSLGVPEVAATLPVYTTAAPDESTGDASEEESETEEGESDETEEGEAEDTEEPEAEE